MEWKIETFFFFFFYHAGRQQLVGTPEQLSPQNTPHNEVSLPTGNKVQIRSTACQVQFSHETVMQRKGGGRT